MLAYQHFRPQLQPQMHHQYDSEDRAIESYTASAMESFDFNTSAAYNPVSYTSFCDVPTTYVEAPLEDKFNMMRSHSSSSARKSVHEVPPALLSSGSIGSASSSTVGSPYSGHIHMISCHESYNIPAQSFMSGPAIVCDDGYHPDFVGAHFNADLAFSDHEHKLTGVFVDPIMISGERDGYYTGNQYTTPTTFSQPSQPAHAYSPAPSPVPSQGSYHAFSQPVTIANYSGQRRNSMSSQRSGNSPKPSLSGDEEGGEKGRCPHPECGRVFKDLKAHMLTHQATRPEKCPILNCEYNQKGFARRYDKNRHTLTHYKGTMVCGFCPGSGSPSEKSFNRADVFKRHLTSQHGVEQNPPNSRKRSPSGSSKKLSSYCPDATGKCSTCSSTFNNAQDFYEHLDECVLRVVQQEEPSEAINAANLAMVAEDPAVLETFDRHMIKTESEFNPLEDEEDEDEEMEEDEDEDDGGFNDRSGRGSMRPNRGSGARVIIGGNITKHVKGGKRGMTWSKGGVPLIGKGRKRRKHYPPSWGMSAEKMRMKKRVLCVYDGSRRLLKDDMMLHNEFEVRMRLPNSDQYVTDLDVETIKRANAFHDAPEEEKREWMPQQDFLSDLMA